MQFGTVQLKITVGNYVNYNDSLWLQEYNKILISCCKLNNSSTQNLNNIKLNGINKTIGTNYKKTKDQCTSWPSNIILYISYSIRFYFLPFSNWSVI